MKWLAGAGALLLGLFAAFLVHAQVIEFESNGLKYQTLTKNGVTVMYAPLGPHIQGYVIVQSAISAPLEAGFGRIPGLATMTSTSSFGTSQITLQFKLTRPIGQTIPASPAPAVISMLIQKGNRSDVIKLVSTYEMAFYGISRMRSTNGYEQRRQAALAETSRLKAAATASALALVQTRLAAGESTDGAVFFPTSGKPLGPGHLEVRTNTDTFVFNSD